MEHSSFLWFILGLALIIKGSDWFVEGAVWIARALKVSDVMIGATLVSICTTLPEAMVSTSSTLRGNTDMAMGNVLGSIAFNSAIILGLIIYFTQPRVGKGQTIKPLSVVLVVLLGTLWVLGLIYGVLYRSVGLALLLGLVLFIGENIKQARSLKSRDKTSTDPKAPKGAENKNQRMYGAIGMFIVGLAMTIGGADLLVEHGEAIARMLGVPDLVIGLTMTSVGTSLPELVTAIAAIRKKAQDLSVGNIIGANLLNILLVVGIVASISPITMGKDLLYFYLPFTMLITVFAAWTINSKKGQILQWKGVALFGIYGIYLAFIILQSL